MLTRCIPHDWTHASPYQNTRPSAEDLPHDLALTVTSCWKEDPNDRPNFTQITHMLLHYLSTISPPERTIPLRIFASENAVFHPESPGTSSLMAKRDDNCDTPKTLVQNKPRGFFFCFNQCYWKVKFKQDGNFDMLQETEKGDGDRVWLWVYIVEFGAAVMYCRCKIRCIQRPFVSIAMVEKSTHSLCSSCKRGLINTFLFIT